MRPLSNSFKDDGFQFSLVKRIGDIALFAKAKPNGVKSWEVVKIQKRRAEMVFGKPMPAREVMPRSADWGMLGWTYSTLADAEEKFRLLCEEGRF